MFATVLGWLGSLLGGPFAKAAVDAYGKKLAAENTTEKTVADLAAKEIALDQRSAELNAQIVVAEQGNWVTRSVRPLLALPVIILVWKLLVWDKALGQWTNGSTDSLSDQIWWYCTTVTIAYFGGRTVENVATKIAGVFKK